MFLVFFVSIVWVWLIFVVVGVNVVLIILIWVGWIVDFVEKLKLSVCSVFFFRFEKLFILKKGVFIVRSFFIV